MEDQGYFYIIPAELAENGKPYKALLFGLITSLTKKNGKCTASNQFLASKLGYKDRSTVSRYIKELENEGYLAIVNKPNNERIIAIGFRCTPKGVQVYTDTPPSVKTDDSNISISNINSNNIEQSSIYTQFKENWKSVYGKYPTGGKTLVDYPIKRLTKQFEVSKLTHLLIYLEENRDEYAPIIKNPKDLEDKWNSVINFYRSKEQRRKNAASIDLSEI